MNELLPLSNNLPLDQNPAAVYLTGLTSERSRRVMRISLRNIVMLLTEYDGPLPQDAEWSFPWHMLRYQHTQLVRTRLIENYAPATVNRHLAALRGVLKEAWRLGHLDVETYNRAIDIPNVKNETLPAGRNIPDAELRKILLDCYDDGVKGIRDLAVIGLLATTGIRRAEFENLKLEDFDPETGSLKIVGKGRKERLVYVVNTARRLLDDWLSVRGGTSGPLFYSMHKGDYLTSRRMTAQAAYQMVLRRAERVGLEKITPHDFRRTFVGNMLEAGVDAVTLTRITGHASVEMLKRYDRRPEAAKQIAQKKIDLPL